MDIKNFVSQALLQISDGVIAAQTNSQKAKINPKLDNYGDYLSKKNYKTSWDSIAQVVDFDIAVVTESSENKDVGGSIKVLGISAGGGSEIKNQESSTSRVKFQVLIEFPSVDRCKS